MSKRIYPHSYKLEITDLSGGKEEAFEIYVPALDAYIFGDTIAEALEGYLAFFDDEVKLRKKEGRLLPKPDFDKDIIKQVPLRVPERIYKRISKVAKKEGRSFNSFVTHLLEEVA